MLLRCKLRPLLPPSGLFHLPCKCGCFEWLQPWQAKYGHLAGLSYRRLRPIDAAVQEAPKFMHPPAMLWRDTHVWAMAPE